MPNALIETLLEELQVKTGHEANTLDARLENLLKRTLIAMKVTFEQAFVRIEALESERGKQTNQPCA